MVTTTTCSMREFPGLGRLGSVARAEVVLPKGHDAPSAAAPEASARFFTSSRRFIFTRCSERKIGGERVVKSRSRPRAGFRVSMIADKSSAIYEFRVKNHLHTTESNADIR